MFKTIITFATLAMFAIGCGSSDPESPSTAADSGGTDTSASDSGNKTPPCLSEADGAKAACKICTANCQYAEKSWCDGSGEKVVDACPTDNLNGTCRDSDPFMLGTKITYYYYKHPSVTAGKDQCDIAKGTWEPAM